MAWPQANEFGDALVNPRASFIDPQLREAEVVTDALGLPIPASGQFGIVYQMRSPQGRWAVKCFTKPLPGRQERYRRISAHLKNANLPFIVGFDYLEQGVFIDEAWYPVLKMDWVEGQTLNQFVAERIDKPGLLKLLTEMWLKLAQRLRDADITHADLQHGNVMLIPGKSENTVALKLVDYDGMYLPSLAGTNSGELGHPTYQHPQRLAEGYYGPEVDRFSQLVIYTALRALQTMGRDLWTRYDHGDNLLFNQADFKVPAQSKVLRELWQTGPDDVRALAARLVLTLQQPLQQVPPLHALLAGSDMVGISVDEEQVVARLLGDSKIAPAETPTAPESPAEEIIVATIAGAPPEEINATPPAVPFEEALTKILSVHAGRPGVHLAPNIPAHLLAWANFACMVPLDETILALFECTPRGAPPGCLLFGRKRFYYYHASSPGVPNPGCVPYETFAARAFARYWLFCISVGNDRYFSTAGSTVGRRAILDILNEISHLKIHEAVSWR